MTQEVFYNFFKLIKDEYFNLKKYINIEGDRAIVGGSTYSRGRAEDSVTIGKFAYFD